MGEGQRIRLDDLRNIARDFGYVLVPETFVATLRELTAPSASQDYADRQCWCGSPAGFRADKGFIDCLADRMHDWAAPGARR